MNELNQENRPISDDDLILLYYGEQTDLELAGRVANDDSLRERMNRVIATLEALDAQPVAPLAGDERERIWRAVSPAPGASREGRIRRWLNTWMSAPAGLALAASIAIAVLAISLVRQPAEEPADSIAAGTVPAESLPSRYAKAQLVNHLEMSDVLLTSLANGVSTDDEHWIQTLLIRNRLHRMAAQAENKPELVRLLSDLETVLLELANTSRTPANAADSDLLFRVRTAEQNQRPKRT